MVAVTSPSVAPVMGRTDADRAGAALPALRAGIIGTGFMGEVHARAVRAAGATVAAVAGSSPQRTERSLVRLGAARGAGSALELVASDDVDVVHICTPNHLHEPLAAAALAAGKHVVCEKPLATTRADAQRLTSAAAEAGVVAAVPFVYRYHPMAREAHARVASGETGAVRLVHGSYLQDWLSAPTDDNWRVDARLGGASRAFADIGVHWCDLAEFVTGQRIVALAARTVTAHPQRGADDRRVDTEDAATLLFETDGGALGSLVVSQVTPGRKNRLWLSVDGAETSMAFDQELPEALWVGRRQEVALVHRGSQLTSAEAQRYSVLPPGHPQGYQDCFDAFVADTYRAIGGETPPGLPTFADGLRASVLTEAVLSSAASRAWVEVPAVSRDRTPR
jgi:predicted dehydrogenase